MTGEQKDRVYELVQSAVGIRGAIDRWEWTAGDPETGMPHGLAMQALIDAAEAIRYGDVDALYHRLFGAEREVVG